jgi:hypothetical protein
MIRLFLDIETLPVDETLKGEIIGTPPQKLRTMEEVEEWIEEEYRRTALNGDFGRILGIGYIKETPEGMNHEVISGDESQILGGFWEVAKDVDLFIGHNLLDFDLKFIMKRSIVHRVKPTKELNFARYRNNPIYDTMHEWERWSGRIKLDELAKVFGFESSKGELDGSKVYDYYKEGRLEEIYRYCRADVELTRKIYNRMNFVE